MNIQEIIIVTIFIITLIYVLHKVKRRFADRDCDCTECGISDCDKRV